MLDWLHTLVIHACNSSHLFIHSIHSSEKFTDMDRVSNCIIQNAKKPTKEGHMLQEFIQTVEGAKNQSHSSDSSSLKNFKSV